MAKIADKSSIDDIVALYLVSTPTEDWSTVVSTVRDYGNLILWGHFALYVRGFLDCIQPKVILMLAVHEQGNYFKRTDGLIKQGALVWPVPAEQLVAGARGSEVAVASRLIVKKAVEVQHDLYREFARRYMDALTLKVMPSLTAPDPSKLPGSRDYEARLMEFFK